MRWRVLKSSHRPSTIARSSGPDRCAYGITLEPRVNTSPCPGFVFLLRARRVLSLHPVHCLRMTTPQPTEFNPVAGLAALIFPGAGHLVLGRTKRAALICIGVMGLFTFGLLIGGIDAIDSKNDKIWFYAQVLVGVPTIAVNHVHQSQFKAADPNNGYLRSGFPGEHRQVIDGQAVWQPLTQEQIASGMGPPNVPGLGRINEIAMLSIVLAGMLNLIVFLDALMPSPEKQARPKATPATNGGDA